MTSTNPQLQDIVKRFGTSDDVAEQAAALSELMKIKQHHQAAKDPLFERGVQTALRVAGTRSDPERRLVAVATLLRIAELVKAWQPRIAKALASVWTEALPPLQSAADPDDRYYLAKLWHYEEQPWFRSYLAIGAVEEEGSERVRGECMTGLVALSPDLASILDTLLTPMRRLDFGTEKPGDSKGKRLRRVLESLRNAYMAVTKDPGEAAGQKLRHLLLEAFQLTGMPSLPAVLDEVTEEALGMVHAIVRARFSTATATETYAAMEVVRSWYREHSWADLASESASARLLARDISEAIEMLVRAGVKDDMLYGHLETAEGSPERARGLAREILARTRGLPDELARWLSGTQVRHKSPLAAQNQLLTVDQAIGQLLLDSARVTEMSECIRQTVLPEVRVMAPRASGALEDYMGLVRSTSAAIQSVAQLRCLEFSGTAGDVVEFSPLEHEMASGLTPGTRMVRIVRPGIATPSDAGGRRVVRKTMVEPISG
jgi:hypothetical protein